MSKCCINCFNDSALIEKIQRMGKISRCSFCSSKDVLCVEPSILSDVSDGIEFCIDEDIHGKALHEILSHDLNILSSTVNKPAELVKELALGVDDSKNGRLNIALKKMHCYGWNSKKS